MCGPSATSRSAAPSRFRQVTEPNRRRASLSIAAPTCYERISLRALSTFEHLPSEEIEQGFMRFARDAERSPDRIVPVYPATMLILRRAAG